MMKPRAVKVGDITISLLMYADDLVMLAPDEDEQCLLDTLNIWCVKWRLQINQDKSQIVHFRNQSRKSSDREFKTGHKVLDVVSK